ncbi:MAG: fucose pyrophosphorylase domain-containing protein [Pirellulales bacterium]
MNALTQPWDYLIVTASNEAQAQAYRWQLGLRQKLGMLSDFAEVLVVPDAEGKRVGSGGSTLDCLVEVLRRECPAAGANPATAEDLLRRRRILILHAGGDSRRLPAYGPCGKIFVPVPGESQAAAGPTVFDHLLAVFAPFPAMPAGRGQVVVAAGDALIQFDPAAVRLAPDGLTALGCLATIEESSHHGVFCIEPEPGETQDSKPAEQSGRLRPVRRFLQKPSADQQARSGAVTADGRSILDVAVMSFDARVAAALLAAFEISAAPGGFAWSAAMRETILTRGLDLYREICCALGREATEEQLVAGARAAGSAWDEPALRRLFGRLNSIPFFVQVLPRCDFLHFGTTRELIASGRELLRQAGGDASGKTVLSINNAMLPGGLVGGESSWLEGCRVGAPVELAGRNVVVGADIDEPLVLPEEACLDTLAGRNRRGEPVWFARCYGTRDSFKDTVANGATFCGLPLADWLARLDAAPGDLWDDAIPAGERTLWNARVFPAADQPGDYRRWLWLFEPAPPTESQRRAFLAADRYSAAEVAVLADPEAFHARRSRIFAQQTAAVLPRFFAEDSAFSAEDLAHTLANVEDRAGCVAGLLAEAKRHADAGRRPESLSTFAASRVLHSLGSALEDLEPKEETRLATTLPGLEAAVSAETAAWLRELDLAPTADVPARRWAAEARRAAFVQIHEAIFRSSMGKVERPRCALRPDETVWGRAPARLELGGGWTDTPPYTLEHGGSVINTAIDLNGQPPIHCYARVTPELVIRLNSVDTGRHVEITELEQLLDYHRPQDPFALVKAALAICGFSPETAEWPSDTTLRQMLREFGGGMELTTIVGIPQGSGLGTSSILGAAIVAVVQRMLGRSVTQRQLFHEVLRLEQALTTGGGWQDQIGGGVGGTKITSTLPGMFPDPAIRPVPSDLLDPANNGGSTLIYYIGVTRLAKNILQQVVGGYLNRNRSIMSALAQEHQVAACVADALTAHDAEALGHFINEAWRLQKQLCGEVTNELIESLLDRVRPHIHGARISGAGSGGFLIMIGKSPEDAAHIRRDLEARPLNDRSRFFEYQINRPGLEVTRY